jgi:hypothetical protein
MAVHPTLQAEAVEMLKNGHAPGAVFAHLCRRGVPSEESNACVAELVALKAQADARDPKRLREDATRMLFQGAPIDYVVGYFASLGIAEEHARPEVMRLAEAAKSMVPCQTCTSPMSPKEAFFDAQGNQVCKKCNSRNDLSVAQQRAIEAEKNDRFNAIAFGAMAGVAGGGAAVRTFANYRASNAPQAGPSTCPRCNLSSGAHVSTLPPHILANLPPGYTYACTQCGMGIA